MKKHFGLPGFHEMEQEKIQVITKRFRTQEMLYKYPIIVVMAESIFIEKLIRSNSTPFSSR